MTRRRIDWAAVRVARTNLRKLAEEHPEAFDRLPTAEDLPLIMALHKEDPTIPLTMRFNRGMLDDIDKVVERMQAREAYRRVTRADAVRYLLLKALETEDI
jgi:hypothetical protein